jgi:hypothetical protein
MSDQEPRNEAENPPLSRQDPRLAKSARAAKGNGAEPPPTPTAAAPPPQSAAAQPGAPGAR